MYFELLQFSVNVRKQVNLCTSLIVTRSVTVTRQCPYVPLVNRFLSFGISESVLLTLKLFVEN